MKDEQGIYAEPPPELKIAFDCLKFHILPRVGGLHNQPKLLMHRMRIALNTYENVQAYRSASNLNADAFSKWSGQNSKLIKFMEYVWSLQGFFDE